MSRPAVGDRVVVVRDSLAESLPGSPVKNYTDETGTVKAVRPGHIFDRVMVELDHEGIPMWFASSDLEVTP